MRQRTPIVVRTYELDAVDRHRLTDAAPICHGQAPYPRSHRPARGTPADGDAEPMDFSLHMADGGALLVLYRSGYLPRAIRVNEVIASWLRALEEDGEARPHPDLARETDDA